MEPDLSNYINGIKVRQPAPVEKARIISPASMTREQVYEHIKNNPAKTPEVARGFNPELERMASELKKNEYEQKKIQNQAQQRKEQALRSNVPRR